MRRLLIAMVVTAVLFVGARASEAAVIFHTGSGTGGGATAETAFQAALSGLDTENFEGFASNSTSRIVSRGPSRFSRARRNGGVLNRAAQFWWHSLFRLYGHCLDCNIILGRKFVCKAIRVL